MGFLRRLFRHVCPALEVRNFRLFLGGRTPAMLGTWIQYPVIPWLVYDITGSKAQLGTVRFLGQLPLILLVMAAGVAADRHSRRGLVIMTQAGMMLAAFLMGTLAAAGRMSLGILFAFAFVNGIFRAFDVPSRQAFIVDLVGPRQFPNAIALRSVAFNFARLAGPALGGWLLEKYGAGTCFFVRAALFAPVLAALIMMTPQPRGQVRSKAGGLAGIATGVRYVWHNRRILRLMALWLSYSIFGVSYSVLTASFAKDIYGKQAGEFGILISFQGLGAVTASLIMAATSRSRRPQRWAVAGMCLVAMALVVLAANSSYAVALACMAILGFGFTSFTVSSDTLIQLMTADAFRGRVMGLRTLVFGGTMGLGALLAGLLASTVGLRATVATGAGAVALAVALLGPGILAIDPTAKGGSASETHPSPAKP